MIAKKRYTLEQLEINIEVLSEQIRDNRYERREISLMCDKLLDMQQEYKSKTGRYYERSKPL